MSSKFSWNRTASQDYGGRAEQQDAFILQQSLWEVDGQAQATLFAVFDGHGTF